MLRGDKNANTLVGGAGEDHLRSAQGADTLTGGLDHDTFLFLKKDVMLDGVHQGVDIITDFASNDTIDLRDLVKQAFTNLDDVVHITQVAGGSMLSVNVDGVFVDVAMLMGVNGGSAAGWASDGMMLA